MDDRGLLWEASFRGADVIVPVVVLVEVLTGDHRRDHATERFLRQTVVAPADADLCRSAARLRHLTSRKRPSAVDAIVVALADAPGTVVLTSDPLDISALAANAVHPIRVQRV